LDNYYNSFAPFRILILFLSKSNNALDFGESDTLEIFLEGQALMITVTQGRNCEICGKNEAIVVCNGCGQALCEECRIFDIWYCGCGHANSQVFCSKCDADPKINIWKSRD
jgi:hypothetical protein